MGKLSAFADRMKDTKARLEVEVDRLNVKLDGIDQAAPKAFDQSHRFLDAQAGEIQEIEDTLRQLSNLPFGSEPLPKGSETVTDALKPNGPGLPRAGTIDAPGSSVGAQGSIGAQGGSAQVPTFPAGTSGSRA